MGVKILPPEEGKLLPKIDKSGISRKWLEVDYTPGKPHESRKLDIYLPEEGDGPFPTLVCIHGGAFSGGEKDDYQIASYMEGLERGMAVVSVEQRLCKKEGRASREGEYPNALFDYKAAIRYLKAKAGEYKLDERRIATAGVSAGGYHALMAAATQDIPAMYDNTLGWSGVDGSVGAVVTQFGVGDLIVQSEYTEEAGEVKLPGGELVKIENFADIFLGVKIREHKNLAYFASPETWITKTLPPVLMQHGTADEIVPVESSRRLAKRIEEVCGAGRVRYEEYIGYRHGDARFNSKENIERIFEWLREKLRY